MASEYTIPVLVRRVYGTRYRLVSRRPAFDSNGGGSGFPGGGPGGFPPEVPRAELVPEIDRRHGTRLSLEEIRAMFVADPDFANSEDMTVNDIWRSTGIRFAISAEQDEAVASDYADFWRYSANRFTSPEGTTVRSTEDILNGLNIAGVVNLYFVRDILGARGQARVYRPHFASSTTHILMADNSDLDSWRGGGEEGLRFRRWRNIVTLAHEFGHVLGLPHVPQRENVMYGEGTTGSSSNLDRPQISVARYRAKFLSGAETPSIVGSGGGPPGSP